MEDAQETRANAVFFTLSLFCILVLAGYLRFWTLGQQSLWFDEAFSWWQSHRSLPGLLKSAASDNTPPLHSLILFVLTRAFGDSEVILRLPSAAFGVANVAAIYWLGAILNNRPAGLLAALLLALSEFHIWYSQEARAYALLALSATLFAIASLRYLQRPTFTCAFWAALSGTVLLYSHAYGTLTWFSIAAAILAIILMAPAGSLATGSHWLLIQALAAGPFLPWVLIVLRRPFGGRVALEAIEGRWIPDPNLNWILEPTWRYVLDQLAALASGHRPLVLLSVGVLAALTPQISVFTRANQSRFEFLCRNALLLVWLVSPTALGLGLALLLLSSLVITRTLRDKPNTLAALTALTRQPGFQMNGGIGLLSAWLLGPPVLGLVASVTLQPLFTSRYLAGSLPAWLLLASIGITRIAPRTGFAVVAFSMACFAALGLLNGPGKRQDWRAVASLFAQQKQVGDCVVIYQSYMVTPFEYYYREQIPCLDLPVDPGSIRRSTLLANRAWIILANASPDKGRLLVDTLLAGSRNQNQESVVTSLMKTGGHGGIVDVSILSRK